MCACINDDLGGEGGEEEWGKSVEQMHQVLERLLPIPGQWEKKPVRTLGPIDASWFENNQPLEVFLKSVVLVPSVLYCAFALKKAVKLM